MAGYLTYNDYAVTIQDFAFKQIIANNDLLRLQTEPRAQAKIKEYLTQKYDLATEFANTTILSDSATYQANALVQLNYTAWTSQNYIVGAYVSYTDGNVYRCILNTTSSQVPTNTTYWILIGAQLGLIYLNYPYPVFNSVNVYNIGDNVYWNGKVYSCLVPTVIPSHAAELQAYQYQNIPPLNVFPDDKVNGATYWGVGTPYSVSGIYPNFVATKGTWTGLITYSPNDTVNYNGVLWQAIKTNTNKIPGTDIVNWKSITWVVGDNRNQSIVDTYVAIVLYYLSFRISPKAVPNWIQAKYDYAMNWLQMGAEGKITLDIPEIQPYQGGRIRFGGNVKQINGY